MDTGTSGEDAAGSANATAGTSSALARLGGGICPGSKMCRAVYNRANNHHFVRCASIRGMLGHSELKLAVWVVRLHVALEGLLAGQLRVGVQVEVRQGFHLAQLGGDGS